MVIDGEYLTPRHYMEYCRYHLVVPSVPRRSPSTQDMVGGENNHTPVVFGASDNCNIVGRIPGWYVNISSAKKRRRRFPKSVCSDSYIHSPPSRQSIASVLRCHKHPTATTRTFQEGTCRKMRKIKAEFLIDFYA